jgi:hypothetical protein
LLELYASDPGVKAQLDAKGAVSAATKNNPLSIDTSKVDRTLIHKAKAHVHAAGSAPKPFRYKGIMITVAGLSREGDLLRVDLTADCPTDGPYYFRNPPLCVVTKPAVYSGETLVSPRESVEDPASALKAMIGEAVATVGPQGPFLSLLEVSFGSY